MNKFIQISSLIVAISLVGCAHTPTSEVAPEDAAKLDRKLVKDSVVFEDGTKDGAVVPEISSPRLRAVLMPERVENNRFVSSCRGGFLRWRHRHPEPILDALRSIGYFRPARA